jgi:hypothetical protein
MAPWVLYAFSIVIGGTLSTWSWQAQSQAKAELNASLKARKAAYQERVLAAEKRDSVNSVAGRERFARERGYVYPGEDVVTP